MSFMKPAVFFVFFLLGTLFSCAGRPPFLEYTLAHQALKSAKTIQSEKHAVHYWLKANRYFHTGERKYRNRDYMSSKRFFNESLKWAQKAENLTRYKMSTGDAL